MSGPPAEGTAPPGAAGEEEAARWVRGMFGRVAHRYDFLNHLLSFNLDRFWRARAVRELRTALERPGARVLDLCCGTGDLLLALAGASPPGSSRLRPLADARGSVQAVRALGIDFCHPMLVAARGKVDRRRADAALVEADALALPLADRSLDVVATAFGFRNLANYERGLRELERVLKPGGTAAILEFSQPPSAAFAALYRFYSRRILPAIGGAVSGERGAYEYLPESVRKFPAAGQLADMMREAGFVEVRFERLTGGIVALHVGRAKP
jgi:demethylmenaquinone methyltransferase/2-methoxy-6-polyprenyl-1,4-benzoquinol methylase